MRNGNKLGEKAFKAAMATAVATGTLVAAVPTSILGVSAAETSFSDVNASHFYYESVLHMASKGIISGYSDGTFRAGQDITRGQAANIIANSLRLDTKNVKDPGFKDVTKSYPFYEEIAALVNAGIIKGYTDDTFKPTESLTRAQMAQYVVLGFDLEQENLPKLPFKDVNAKSAHAKYIQALVSSKITTGKTATTFEPNANLTRGEASAFIHKAGQVVKPKPEIIEDPGTTPDPVTTTKPPLYNSNAEKLVVSQVARYDSGQGETGTEILAYDAKTNKGFVTNGAVGGYDILSFADVKSGEFKQLDSTKRVVIEDYGIPGVKNITSIAAHATKDLIAIAAYAEKTDPGYIIFATKDGKYVKHVEVGALPDMVTFTPDGKKAIVANEGEPNKDTTIDPQGSISVIDVASLTATTLNFTESMLDDNVRTSYKGASILEQLEPEYVTVSDDSKTAYVTLQENNAIATVNLETNTILHVKGLGVIDHSIEGNEMDANKDDKKVDILKQPILTFHMPDAVDTFTVANKTYIITPNEGDSRDYADDGGYSEVSALEDVTLPISLKADNYKGFTQAELDAFDLSTLDGYKVTTENGLNATGTAYEAIYGYGGRSFSIFDATTMEQVYDSGSEFEKIIAEKTPQYFNTNSDEVKVDNRSDDKGPEPETAVVGEVDGITYAFIALERYSGIMVYNLTNVNAPEFVTLISSRDFTADSAGDVSPEGLQFIPASESPTGKAILAATHEVSGTIAVYEFATGS